MERMATATFTRISKRLLVLVVVLVAMLAATVPAFAQEQVSATGVLLAGLPADVGTNGTHSIADEASGTVYALESDAVDLDDYVGQQVTVYGTLTPGEAGSGDPTFEGNGTLPSIEVTRLEPADDPEQDFYSTLTFELEVEGEPPEGTEFFGAVNAGEGGYGFVPLSDADGDGTYTGSTEVFKYVPGAGPGAERVPLEVPVRIGQATGTPGYIGQLDTIEDFGAVLLDEDRTFSASVSFDEDGEGPTTPGVPSPQNRTATFDFELTVKGTPPEGARFFGVVPAEGCIVAPLADPDGDGVFTGSVDVPRFAPGPVPPDAQPVSLPVQIVQADSGGGPCNPTRVIKDFGTVPADDYTFRARASFTENGDVTTPPEPGNGGGSDNGGSNNSGSSGSSGGSGNDAGSSGSPSGVTGGITGLLPSTGGGVALWVLGAGILLVGGGMLVRRIFR